jgi:hypothetical protein
VIQGDRSPILTLDDVKAAGRGGIPADQPTSSFELPARAAAQQGDRTAMAFFADVENPGRAAGWL